MNYFDYVIKAQRILFLFTLSFASLASIAGTVYTEFPDKIDSEKRYVFYSHGFIVEGDDPTPIHNKHGMYYFPEIKQALSDDSYDLIAYHRAKDTKPREFAKKLARDIKKLVSHGVEYSNIYLIGFSRGGAITVLTANELANNDITIIVLAACTRFLNKNTEVSAYGSVYSIYETSDEVGSCHNLIRRSPQVKAFEEIAISTGKGHGAFYMPLPQWVLPVKKWLKATNTNQTN